MRDGPDCFGDRCVFDIVELVLFVYSIAWWRGVCPMQLSGGFKSTPNNIQFYTA